VPVVWRWTGGRETGRKGGGRCMRGGRREGGKRDYEDGGKWEKKGEIMQHGTIFCNKKNCKEAGANKYRAGTGIKEYGKREV